MHEQLKEALTRHLRGIGVLHDDRIERALLMVPLEEFVPKRFQFAETMYQDVPSVFWFKSQVDKRTISAPHMICLMLEYLNLDAGDELLILGSKSGYIAAIASLLCSEGHVYVVDSSEEILELTKKNLERSGFTTNVSLIHGNPLDMAGLDGLGPWDKVLVPYQVEEPDIIPALQQLVQGGVLFAPVGDGNVQFFTQYIKHDGKYHANRITSVLFTPLDQTVTHLSQKVEFYEFMKKVGRVQGVDLPFGVDMEHVKHDLETAKRGSSARAHDGGIEIFYDTPEGERLHEAYRQKTLVERRQDAHDVKLVESLAVELAMANRGKVRLVTLANRLNLPIEVLKTYLKVSSKGKLAGKPDDEKTITFVLDGPVDVDPVVAAIIADMKRTLPALGDALDGGDLDTMRELASYYKEKLDFLDREKEFPVKLAMLAAARVSFLLSLHDASIEHPEQVPPSFHETLDRDLRDAIGELARAIEPY